jgi:phospholipid-binding lipoprotein MlaA
VKDYAMSRRLLLSLLLATAAVQSHAQAPADPTAQQPGQVEHQVVVEQDLARDAEWRAAPRNPADPWEPFNRRVHAFNDVADRWVLRPVASGYRNVTPDPVQRGVGNFFNNLGEIRNILNNLLQGKLQSSASDTGRLLINSTVGVLGVFDVASRWGLAPSSEDFGQTLGRWGVSSGPYLVLPFLGPRTVRDGFGSVLDGYADPVFYVDDDAARIGAIALRIVDTRAALIPAEEMMSGDRYLFLRDAYLQRREYLVRDGVVEDDFGAEDDDDWPAWE